MIQRYKRGVVYEVTVGPASVPLTYLLLVVKLASHLLNSSRVSEDTVVDQSVAYATDAGGVAIGGYYAWGPVVEGMTVSRGGPVGAHDEVLTGNRPGLPLELS